MKGRPMGADTSVVKKKHERNPMAGKEECMEKHRVMEGKGEGDGHQHGQKPKMPVPIAGKLA